MDQEKATAKAPGGGKPESFSADWSCFDRIYCISLDNRGDRRREAMRQFAAVGLADRVEFVIVKKHPTDCEQGIYESHLQCMVRGLAAGAGAMLIFEDDIVFDRFSPQVLARSIEFLRENKDWQVFFLGCMVKWSRRVTGAAVVRIGYRSLTHAYAIGRDFAETMVREHPWRNVAFDDFLRDLESERMYAAYPSFAFQSDSPSDNDPYLPLDRFRRLCGGLRSLQKANEFFQRYKWWIVGAHIVPILAVAAVWL
jgi:hypothetical protein